MKRATTRCGLAARRGYAVSGLLHLLEIRWIALESPGAARVSRRTSRVRWRRSPSFGRPVRPVGRRHGVPRPRRVTDRRSRRFSIFQVRAWTPGPAGAKRDRGRAMVYLVLGWSTLGFAGASSPVAASRASSFPATMLHRAGGRLLVVVIVVGVGGVRGSRVYKGATERFLRENLVEDPGTAGVGPPCRAGWVHHQGDRPGHHRRALRQVRGRGDPPGRRRHRVDGALRTLRHQPLGPLLLTAVAVGLAAYGVYSFPSARYAKVLLTHHTNPECAWDTRGARCSHGRVGCL